MYDDFMPKVSVILPLFNTEKYIVSALESILDQTFKDFEVLILNDGSTDKSVSLIEKLLAKRNEKRVKIIHNDKNHGTSYTLNRGIELSEGEYLARMDSDDICMKNRLEMQVDFLDSHPEIDIVGTAFKTFGKTIPKLIQNPETDSEIKAALFFDCAMTLVMIRKNKLLEFSLHYDPSDAKAEDYEFWTRCAQNLKLANLMEPLFLYRFHSSQASKAKQIAMENRADLAREKYLKDLQIHLEAEALKTHHQISKNNFNISRAELDHWKHCLINQTHLNQSLLLSSLESQLVLRFTRAYFENFFNKSLRKWIIKNNLLDMKKIGFRKKIFYLTKSIYRITQSKS